MAICAGGTGSLPAPVPRYIDSSSDWKASSNNSRRCSRRKPRSLRVRVSLFIKNSSCREYVVLGVHLGMLIVATHEHGVGPQCGAIKRGGRTILHTPQSDRGTATPCPARREGRRNKRV